MWLRVYALILRHLYLYRRSLTRVMEILFWPVMNLMVWGFVTAYLKRLVLPQVVLFLLGAMILWDVLYRSQQAITLSLTEELWIKNIVNVFIAPVRMCELIVAFCAVGIIKAMVTTLFLGFLAYFFYRFNILIIGLALVPFFASLLLFGWAVGMYTMGLVLRYGHAAEALIWGVPFLIQPISAVFYPVDVLPWWLRTIAFLLPSTYVFEGMREVLRSGSLNVPLLLLSYLLNLIYIGGGAAFFAWMLKRVKEKGYLTRFQME
jgi:ABC-2 type transport system permease protein